MRHQTLSFLANRFGTTVPNPVSRRAENLLPTREESGTNVFALLQDAFTRAEIDAAAAAYREHLRRFPEDRRLDLAHTFPRAVEYMEIREAAARNLELSADETDERERLFKESRIAVNAAEDESAVRKLEACRDRLAAWLQRFPNDKDAADRIRNLKNEIEIDQQVHDLFFAV